MVQQAEAEDQPGGPQREQPEERKGTEDAQEGLFAAGRAEQPGSGRTDPPPGSVVEPTESVRAGDPARQDENLERLDEDEQDE